MNDDDVNDENEIKVEATTDLSNYRSKLPIVINEEINFEDSSSGGSSPSALKKRLQDLSSSIYDNVRSIDPSTSLDNSRISCNHRSDKEEKSFNSNQRNEETSNTFNSLHGARARRRAKIRSDILREIDKSLSITNPKVNNLFDLLTRSEWANNFHSNSIKTDSMESLESSTKINDTSTFCLKPIKFTGSLSSRSYRKDNDDNDKDYVNEDNKKKDLIKQQQQRQSKSANEDKRNKLFKNKIEVNPILRTSSNYVRPIKCGGYRPNIGIIYKNLSTSSESESIINESKTNPVSRKIGSSTISNADSLSSISRIGLDEKKLSIKSEDDRLTLSTLGSVREISDKRIIDIDDKEKIRDNDSISIKSGLVSTRSKILWINEDKSYDSEISYNDTKIQEREKKIDRRSVTSDSNSLNESNNFNENLRNNRIEQRSLGQNLFQNDNLILKMNSSNRFLSDDRSVFYEKKKMKINDTSFENVEFNDDIEISNTSDNEKIYDNTKVPSLCLYSENVSRSTSADSKTYTPNRSLDSTVFINDLSIIHSRSDVNDKENNLKIVRCKSFKEKNNLDSPVSSDLDSSLNKIWDEPVSMELRNFSERYDEFDISKESRRAFSAPPSKLTTRSLVDDYRGCQSADLSRETIYVNDNTQYTESSYSNNCKTNLSESTGSLNFNEEYQTFNDQLVTSYSHDNEKSNTYPIEYLINSIYPRQSHLSILKEESETRLEDNDRSESFIEKKDSFINNLNNENINRSESIRLMSTDEYENRKIVSKIDDKTSTNSIKSNDINKENTLNDTIENRYDIELISNCTNLIITDTINDNKLNVKRKENERMNDVNEIRNNEYKIDITLNDTIDDNDRLKDIKSWIKIDENTRSVKPNTTMLIIKNIHEMRTLIPAKVSNSTSRLDCAFERNKSLSHFKNKKSQDRFPFTISETESMTFESRNDVNSKEKFIEKSINKSKSLETFYESTCPIVADFFQIPYDFDPRNDKVRRSKDDKNILPKMKGLVRRLSNKFTKSSSLNKRNVTDRQNNIDDLSTKIIYQNEDCRIDSKPESYSDESMIEKSDWIVSRSNDTRSSIISSGKLLKKTTSLENLTTWDENPGRRYDRDDEWVKEFKERCSETMIGNISSSKENIFSIIRSKNESCDSLFENISKESSRLRDKNKFIDSTRYENDCSLSNIKDTNVDLDNDPDIDNEDNGCLCFKFYRMLRRSLVISTKNRNSIVQNDSLIDTKTKMMKKKKKKKK